MTHPSQTVITLIKTSLSISDPVRITTALFYREDGTIDPTPVLVDEDSWKEIAPYVHTIHVEDDLERPSTALSTISAHSTLSGSVVGLGNGSASSSTGTGVSKGSSLNSSASAFVPLSNSITIKTSDGAKVNLQGLRKPSFSPSCGSRSVHLTGLSLILHVIVSTSSNVALFHLGLCLRRIGIS